MIIKKELSSSRIMLIGESDEIYSVYKSIKRANRKGSTYLHSIYTDSAKVNAMNRVYGILIDEYTSVVDFINSDCILAILIDEGDII